MKTSIFRSILIGVLLGLLVFITPRLIIALLIIGAIFKLSGKGRWRRAKFREHKMAFADKVRNMSEEEYSTFKSNTKTQHYC